MAICADALFGDLVGQRRPRALLERALEAGPSHAYLFTGPPGVGKTEAALAFAAALCCNEGGCGVCPVCRRVREGIHPDVDLVSPEGTFITVDQIREINRETSLRPFESRSRVTIITEAEAMNTPAANAFLKTLEEPPPHAYFVLVTNAVERLLPTIVSRCQRVAFQPAPAQELEAYLHRCCQVTDLEARSYARASEGSPSYARRLAESAAAREHRDQLISWARRVPEASFYDLEVATDEILASLEHLGEERAAELETARERQREWAGDARARNRIEKLFDQRIKRERRRAQADGLADVLRVFAGWYRDLATVAVGADEAALNQDYLYELRNSAFAGMVPGYLGAVDAVKRAQERFRYNVDAKCTLEDMLLAIKEALLP